jgi:hypothetical protein
MNHQYTVLPAGALIEKNAKTLIKSIPGSLPGTSGNYFRADPGIGRFVLNSKRVPRQNLLAKTRKSLFDSAMSMGGGSLGESIVGSNASRVSYFGGF